jgi:hypothetical protein
MTWRFDVAAFIITLVKVSCLAADATGIAAGVSIVKPHGEPTPI